MTSAIPKLKFSLARNALVHFFRSNYLTADEVNFTQLFCSRHDSNSTVKLKMRFLAEENNDMLVASILADASCEEYFFLYDKYRLGRSFFQISDDLNVHVNGLQRWRDKFLTEIASLQGYDLPSNDVFSRNKVEALVFVLERTIAFHETYRNNNADVLSFLKFKLNVYQNLLFAIKFFLLSDSQELFSRIIKAKILNQRATFAELECITESSHTSIRHYLDLFQQHFYSIK